MFMESFVAVSIVFYKFARKGDNRLYANTRTSPSWLDGHLLMPPINTQVQQHSPEPFDRNLSHHYITPLTPQVFPRVMYPVTLRAICVSAIAADSAPSNKVGEAISTA
jgi:hypothetical protein